jgi:methylsterol monooxygenase
MTFMSWLGIHNHCGFDTPWDLPNKWLRYVNRHDYHHESFNQCYQTVFSFWDKLIGADAAYWVAWEKKVEARKKRELAEAKKAK